MPIPRRAPLLALALAGAAVLAGGARAQPLQIVTVGAPAVNCVFNTSCTVVVTDHATPLFGSGFLQSRTYQGQPGSPAAGMWAYVYRIDLTQVDTVPAPRVTALTIDFGPVVNTLDYNGDGSTGEHVFVTTSGGLGSVGPAAATRSGNTVTFRFSPAVEAGQTSYFFGLVSRFPPQAVTAHLSTNVNPNLAAEARAPRRGRPDMGRPGRGGRLGGAAGPVAPEDCIAYDPATLRTADEGAQGWLLTDGSSRMLMLDDQADAERALALARRHTHQCFIGRNNSRPNRYAYITQYWRGTTGAATTIAGEDCLAYNPATVGVFDRGALGWRMEDGSHAMLLFDNQADANRGLVVAKANSSLCFIGRGNSRPNRENYIVEYWK